MDTVDSADAPSDGECDSSERAKCFSVDTVVGVGLGGSGAVPNETVDAFLSGEGANGRVWTGLWARGGGGAAVGTVELRLEMTPRTRR